MRRAELLQARSTAAATPAKSSPSRKVATDDAESPPGVPVPRFDESRPLTPPLDLSHDLAHDQAVEGASSTPGSLTP